MLILIIIGSILLAWLLFGYLSNFFLATTTYEIDTGGRTGEHTLAVVCDLHHWNYGRNNSRLLARIKEAGADAVLIPGDLVVKHVCTSDKKVQRVLTFLRTLHESYPVFYSPGNHEIRMADHENYKIELEHIGIGYADNRELSFPDDGIRLYGLELPIEWFREKRDLSVAELGEFLNKPEAGREGEFTILLAHDPRHFETYADWGADLTLSGHLHGGILRLPIVGGVFSPYMRLFPKYDAGLFEKNGKRMIVSRGLGTHHVKLRWFNRPELVVVRLK